MKPNGSKYPAAIDSDDNLYFVKDALQVPLGIDHLPGNNFVAADRDISAFPPSGIITLVDQCSAAHERIVSFYYGKRTNKEFLNLELLANSTNTFKPKKLTTITMQVMSDHREALKDGVIAIEKYLGTKHDSADQPNGETIFARINFLRKLMYAPRAWVEMDRTSGVAPLTVTFTFAGTGNTGPVGDVVYKWTFGEDEIESKNPSIQKTFFEAGKYTVKVKITNHYGEDEVCLTNAIDIRGQAPEAAILEFKPLANQLFIPEQPGVPLRIRTPINQPVSVMVSRKPDTDMRTSAGALIDTATSKVLDPITSYTWNMGDDLTHGNSPQTKAIYNIGGLYDTILRTDTEKGSYRVTVYDKCVDVVEPLNLWLWDIDNKVIKSNEFGLLSETFKAGFTNYALTVDDSFLDPNMKRQKFEFWRNNGIARNEVKSGDAGTAMIFWAGGRAKDESRAYESINFVEHNGFFGSYSIKGSTARPWNWAAFSSEEDVYFLLGNNVEDPYPTLSLTNQTLTAFNLKTFTFANEEMQYKKYKNGAHDLTKHLDVFDENYDVKEGHFAGHRTTWKNHVGYMLRNAQLGHAFSFVNFYKTEGTIGSPLQNIVKLPDLPGDGHKEGELVSLSNGIYFFSTNGSAYCFNDTSNIWEMVTPHNRISRNELDSLFAASDNENRAYVSIEGLTNGFFKFNAHDLSYTTLVQKPAGKQWLMSVY